MYKLSVETRMENYKWAEVRDSLLPTNTYAR